MLRVTFVGFRSGAEQLEFALLKTPSNSPMSANGEAFLKTRLPVMRALEMPDEAMEGRITIEGTQASISEAINLIDADQDNSQDIQRCMWRSYAT
jgi:hypothetical protein